jgi:hypothetical protein
MGRGRNRRPGPDPRNIPAETRRQRLHRLSPREVATSWRPGCLRAARPPSLGRSAGRCPPAFGNRVAMIGPARTPAHFCPPVLRCIELQTERRRRNPVPPRHQTANPPPHSSRQRPAPSATHARQTPTPRGPCLPTPVPAPLAGPTTPPYPRNMAADRHR